MDKIIVMGLAQTGKTTIIRVAAEGYSPSKTAPYSATLEYKRKTYNLFGKKISVFDLGGQKSFLERFVGSLANFIFSNVTYLVYIVDIVKVSELNLSQYYLNLAIENLKKFSPEAKIAIFLHKIDLIDQSKKDDFIATTKEFFDLSNHSNISFYETTVFNESAIRTMEKIVEELEDEPPSFEKIFKDYYYKFSKHILDLFLWNDGNETIFQSRDEIPTSVNEERALLNTQNTIYNEKALSTMIQFNSRIVLIALLPNDYFLRSSYLISKNEIATEKYTSIVSSFKKLLEDLINFI